MDAEGEDYSCFLSLKCISVYNGKTMAIPLTFRSSFCHSITLENTIFVNYLHPVLQEKHSPKHLTCVHKEGFSSSRRMSMMHRSTYV